MTKSVIPSFEGCRRVVTHWRIWRQTANRMLRCSIGSMHLAVDSTTHEIQAIKANRWPRSVRSKALVDIGILLLPLHQTLISCYAVLWLSWQKHIPNAGFIGSMHLTHDSATHEIQANKGNK